MGHATERHALHAANAPGRAFPPHSQRDVVAKHLINHKAAGGNDPTKPVPMRKASGSPSAVVPAQDVFEGLLPQAVLADANGPTDIVEENLALAPGLSRIVGFFFGRYGCQTRLVIFGHLKGFLAPHAAPSEGRPSLHP
jgi:hypothetical protein